MKRLIATMLMVVSLITPLAFAGVSAAQFNPLEESCYTTLQDGTKEKIDSPVCKDAEDPVEITRGDDSVFVKIANAIAFVGGILAVIIIIVAGITLILSSGDPAKVKSSRDTIIYTVVGLFVIILARSIVIFIINAVDKR